MHGIKINFLYAAKRIISYWETDQGLMESTGTGFFIQKDSDLYLITNRHVAELSYSHPEFTDTELKEFFCEGFENYSEDNMPSNLGKLKIDNANKFVFHPNFHNDIACLKNPIIDISSPNAKSIISPIDFSVLATKEKLETNLLVCDTIAYPGFPKWYDQKNNTPIFRMGTIASDPRLNYWKENNNIERDTIAYEGFSSSGSSGSPIFAIQKGFKFQFNEKIYDNLFREVMLVGINAGHFPSSEGHSGISYFYKSQAIIETIEECE